jgi:hypothetical protein
MDKNDRGVALSPRSRRKFLELLKKIDKPKDFRTSSEIFPSHKNDANTGLDDTVFEWCKLKGLNGSYSEIDLDSSVGKP